MFRKYYTATNKTYTVCLEKCYVILKHRWEDNIKMDLEELGGSCGDWMELAQDRDRWRALVGR